MTIIPVINRIVVEDGAFICYDADENLICLTTSKEVAEMYYAIPTILDQQAEIIRTLQTRLEYVTDEYNSLVMGMIPSGSNLIH